jgi:hypothetical protein
VGNRKRWVTPPPGEGLRATSGWITPPPAEGLPGKLFGRDRPDRQKEDRERNFGKIVRISGYSTTVVSAGFVQSLGQFEEDGYIKVTVKVCNRDSDAQPYNYFDWRVQTPSGEVVDPAFVVSAPTLGAEDLVKGGEVAGDVFFTVGGQKGDFFIHVLTTRVGAPGSPSQKHPPRARWLLRFVVTLLAGGLRRTSASARLLRARRRGGTQ